MASYEKRNNNLWTVRFRHFVNGTEKNMRISGFKTKRDAERAYHDYINSHIGNDEPKEEITFLKLYTAYFEYIEKRLKPSTFYDTKNVMNKQLLPYFEKFTVNKIKPIDILNWQSTVETYSYEYKCKLRSYLNALFRFGNKYYDLPIPTDKVDGFRNLEPKKEMTVWTVDEFNRFLDYVDDNEYKVFFSVLFYGGLRKGEAFALQWQDYDFATHELKINKSITRKEVGKSWAITTPKTGNSVRIITVPEVLHNALCSLSPGKKTEFIFGKTRPLVDNTTTRYFQACAKKAELPKIRLHDLRHSCASHLLSNANGVSVSPIAVAKYLGHTVDMLLKTYAHMLPSGKEEIIKKFA